MRVGVAVPTWGPFNEIAALSDFVSCVEELGFESIWLADHVAVPSYATDRFDPPMLEPLAFAGWVLAQHDTLRVGTDVLVAPYRHPVIVAAMAGSLQHLSNGRLILGVGIGYLRGEFAALGLDPQNRAEATDDALRALRTLWSGRGPHAHAGRVYRFDDVLPVAVPADPVPPVPILVGGNNVNARRRAALLGDGWHPLFPTPEAYAAGRAEIEELRSRHSMTGPFLFSYSGPGCEITDAPWRGRSGGRTRQNTTSAEFRYAPDMPTDEFGRLLLRGTPDQVRTDVDAYRQAGVEQLVLRVWGSASKFGPSGAMDQLRRWAEVLR
jgi:probable F420-dependent oxidoreductase